jgi:RNA 2',3'-cyclic 3'-phosphodiesterase
MGRDRAPRPEARSLRLFVAIEIPPEAKHAVEVAVGPWRSAFAAARWLPTENWHVTVKFLGQTWPRLRTWVEERVGGAAASCAPFDTRLAGVGTFPSPRRARVIWAGFDDVAGGMAQIAHALDEGLAAEFRPDRRAFTPHLTVARSDPPLAVPASFGGTAVDPVGFRVDRVVLFRSHLRRPAPVYEPVGTFALGRG